MNYFKSKKNYCVVTGLFYPKGFHIFFAMLISYRNEKYKIKFKNENKCYHLSNMLIKYKEIKI